MKYLKSAIMASLFDTGLSMDITEKLIEYESAHHPIVQADAYKVNIESLGNTDYHGQVYIGSQYEEAPIIFDTMSDWTIVMDSGASNAEM